MVKIRGMSKAENFLIGVNGFGHCLTPRITREQPRPMTGGQHRETCRVVSRRVHSLVSTSDVD